VKYRPPGPVPPHGRQGRRRRRISFALASILAMTSLLAIGVADAAATWSLQTTPKGESRMNEVSCVAGGECFAVGNTTTKTSEKLAMRWNGTEWKSQVTAPELPNPTSLTSVSCTSASACVSVGYFTIGVKYLLAERWDGTAWKRLESGLETKAGEFTAVSCASATECIAGTASGGALRWNGTEWKTSPIEGFSSIKDISCVSSSFCMAAGKAYPSGLAVTSVWNGVKWTKQSELAASVNLESVSCSAANVCTVAGYQESPTFLPVARRWNGTTWSAQSPPAPVGSLAAGLHGVSCPSATVCFATGDYTDGSAWKTLAERWNGTTWEIQSSPNVAGASRNELFDVSCISATVCESVGSSETAGKISALAERSS